jgi:hypothetical protein
MEPNRACPSIDERESALTDLLAAWVSDLKEPTTTSRVSREPTTGVLNRLSWPTTWSAAERRGSNEYATATAESVTAS